jgi:LysM domain
MFEHTSEDRGTGGTKMTIVDSREFEATPLIRPRPAGAPRPAGTRRRPPSRRPGGAPMRYPGTGLLVSRASHRRRPITPATTVVLALIAAAFTVWLGLVAQFGGVVGDSAAVPDRLAVIQVQSGETLHQVARRVAPDAPTDQVMDRIRDLNQLESAALDAGQTLIAPVG